MAATTLPWLPGWSTVRPRRRAARTGAVPVSPAPSLERGERPLIVRHEAGGDRAVATERALYHQPAGAAGEWVRLGWEQVSRANPHERGLALAAWAPGLPPRTVLAVPRPAALLAFARERIAWTTLLTTRVPIGGRPARVTARRQPASGDVLWLVALDPPPAEDELAEALTRLRREFSLHLP